MDVEEALRRIEAGAGTQFDPELAAAFLALGAEGAVRVPSE
jgi:HD-GYP domain-containing protein (c-di-GMP phosphodiesterase class II)